MAARRAAGDTPGPWVAVAGTRPNYVKLAPLLRAARSVGRRMLWIDTGQHRSAALSTGLLGARALGRPGVRLRAPGPGAGRIPKLATMLEAPLAQLRPSLVAVLGDVDSTLAAALAAWRLDLPLVHVEAGLRSYERGMPEERNRVWTDALSDRLYLTEGEALENLEAEGIARSRSRVPGNVMADALHQAMPAIVRETPAGGDYVLATFHRQAAVDDPRRLAALMDALRRCAAVRPVWFPVHPRTRARLRAGGLLPRGRAGGVRLLPPQPYVPFLGLVRGAGAVLTDSGGLQVEAALLDTPCVTLRRRTEHRITERRGGNEVVGTDPRRLRAALRRALERPSAEGARPKALDGQAAERIVADWDAGFRRPRRLPGLPARILRRL